MSTSLIGSTMATGILNGGIYALLALAIVLIFRTTAVANFAQGDMGTFSVFMLLMFFLPLDIPLWAAWLATIALSGGLGAIVYFVLLRPRPAANHLNLTVRTLGLYTLIYAVVVFLWGAQEPYRIPSLFQQGTVTIGGFSISYDQIGTLAVMAVAAAGFLALFRYTQLGLAMRASAMNPEVASLLGVNVQVIMMSVWILAGIMGAVAGMLIAPISFLETGMMRPYLFKAFTAAIMGGLYSFPGAIVGGFILGVAEAFAAVAISIHMREPFTFMILLLVLLIRPAGLFGSKQRLRV
ncbi:branched-chain amino acid transport system permease protein [Rhodoligotrophos appendicifer]|uniref:branched-chain amino acid ABC transporter permease n=1 Tax=Rhodoligotrophos appendicifer TaxID=987056 RepID=UPI001186F48B|nr:branched-chain amino acid ABC transporter permease [Rhodoligotrophos appendicifer]